MTELILLRLLALTAGVLPEEAREIVLRSCLHDHEKKLFVHVIVVMPDHVHMIFEPLRDAEGYVFTLAEILNPIKGVSAHGINKLLGRSGNVWQDESFDHVLRSDEKLTSKIEYVRANPIRRGARHPAQRLSLVMG